MVNWVRKCYWLPVMAISASLVGCEAPSPDLVQGQGTLTNSSLTSAYPAVGYVVNEDGGHACTGTLIDSRTVLTAAHCLNEDLFDTFINYSPRSQIDVYFAADMTSLSGKKRYDAASLHSHPDFGGGNQSDIAVIVLDEPVSGVVPIPLNLDAPAAGQSIEVLGYGETESGDVHRRRVTDNVIDTVFDEVFRFAPGDDVGSVCFGDSGGPSLLSVAGAWHVAGVHTGSTDAECGVGSSYDMRVDAFAGFILDHAYETAADDPGADGDPPDIDPDDAGGCSAGSTGGAGDSTAIIALALIALGVRRKNLTGAAAR